MRSSSGRKSSVFALLIHLPLTITTSLPHSSLYPYGWTTLPTHCNLLLLHSGYRLNFYLSSRLAFSILFRLEFLVYGRWLRSRHPSSLASDIPLLSDSVPRYSRLVGTVVYCEPSIPWLSCSSPVSTRGGPPLLDPVNDDLPLPRRSLISRSKRQRSPIESTIEIHHIDCHAHVVEFGSRTPRRVRHAWIPTRVLA